MATKATSATKATKGTARAGEPQGAETNPFTGPVPADVPLPSAPLIYTVVQLRFPAVLDVERREFVAPFQGAIRDRYPILRQEFVQTLTFQNAESSPQPVQQSVWRFSDMSDMWRVSLTSEFLAIETKAYASREDLLDRLRALLSPLLEHVRPAHIDRIGVRYVNSISGDALSRLPELVTPPLLGMLWLPLTEHIRGSASQSHFQCDEGVLLVQTGIAPAGATLDAGWVPPFMEPSWLLDMDMFTTQSTPCDRDEIIDLTRNLSRRIYAFFRWATTLEFLHHYGAPQ